MPSARARTELERQAQTDQTTDRPPPEAFPSLLEKHGRAIARALPNGMSPERFARVVLTEFRTTKNLDRCAPMTIITCAVTAAQLGLEPGPLGLSYLVPRWASARNVYECTLQIGYRGYVNLARRSGQLLDIGAREVCEHDDFDFSYGFPNTLHHRPAIDTARGQARAYYCAAMFHDGGRHLLVMGRPEVAEHRDRYAAKDKQGRVTGPWVDNFDEMACKTTVRMSAKFLPMATESPLALGTAVDGRSFSSILSPEQLADEPSLVLESSDDETQTAPDAAAAPEAGAGSDGGPPSADPPAEGEAVTSDGQQALA